MDPTKLTIEALLSIRAKPFNAEAARVIESELSRRLRNLPSVADAELLELYRNPPDADTARAVRAELDRRRHAEDVRRASRRPLPMVKTARSWPDGRAAAAGDDGRDD